MEAMVGHMPAKWFYPSKRETFSMDGDDSSALNKKCKVILYLHGGAYMLGGLNSHLRLISKIVEASGVPAFGKESELQGHCHY
eukprot:scaffold42609_cov19-Prasinocladus_malaysianus.AAC.1